MKVTKMATPTTNTKEFTLQGFKFYYYFARDSHGSECHVYYIDGQQVTSKEYHNHIAMIKTLTN